MRWARGWRLIVVIATAVITLTAVGFVWWLNDERDLDRVRARAARAGIDLERWQRARDREPRWTLHLSAPALALRSKTHAYSFSGMRWAWWGGIPAPGLPLPAGIVDHHAAIADALVDEVTAGVLATDSDELALPPHGDAVSSFLVERLLVETRERLPTVYEAACRCVTTPTDLDGIAAAMRWRHAAGALPGVGGGPLRAAAARIWSGLPERAEDAVRLRWQELSRQPDFSWVSIDWSIGHRALREPWADESLSWLTRTRQISDPPLLIASLGRWSRPYERQPSLARTDAVGRWLALGDDRDLLLHEVASQLSAGIAAAVLDGGAMPTDWFAGDGSSIREIRDGERLVRAYSVGTDGTDDGGLANKDLIYRIAADSASSPAARPAAGAAGTR